MNYQHIIENLIDTLKNDAIVNGKAVTWLTNQVSSERTQCVIGPDLYNGMAGMGWVFGEYARLTGGQDAAEISYQCIENAFKNIDKVPEKYRNGFYNGWTGIIYTAVYLDKLFGFPEIFENAKILLKRLTNSQPSSEFDVMTGSAGGIAGLSLVSPILGQSAFDHAIKLAKNITKSSKKWKKTNALVWPQSNNYLPLTGFSHGNAGIGWAFLELWNLLREDWLLDTIYRIFYYETLHYDVIRKNWFDLRHYPSIGALNKLPPKTEVAWCHGAGGIALSRIRAFELLNENTFLNEAIAGTDTLCDHVHSTIESESLPSCLCHGVIGNLFMLEHLKKALAPYKHYVIPKISNEKLDDFISDLDTENMPMGMMIGLSGIVLYLISMQDESVSSPLLPTPIRLTF